jgi:lambda family phage tail tape measure protein
LRSATQTVRDSMRMEFAGAGSSDELKERLKQNLAIEQDYQKQREELLKQYNDAI